MCDYVWVALKKMKENMEVDVTSAIELWIELW